MAGRLRVTQFGIALFVASTYHVSGQQAGPTSTCEASPEAAGCRAEASVFDGVQQEHDMADAANLLQINVTASQQEDKEEEEGVPPGGVKVWQSHNKYAGYVINSDYGPVLKCRHKVYSNTEYCLTARTRNWIFLDSCSKDCHTKKFMYQRWRLENKQLKQLGDKRCADYNFNTGDVYLHSCHGGSNQKWYLTSAGQLKTEHDHNKCLDFHLHSNNAYMHNCHNGDNQKWYWSEMPATQGSYNHNKCPGAPW